jgi:hypothetical protein
LHLWDDGQLSLSMMALWNDNIAFQNHLAWGTNFPDTTRSLPFPKYSFPFPKYVLQNSFPSQIFVSSPKHKDSSVLCSASASIFSYAFFNIKPYPSTSSRKPIGFFASIMPQSPDSIHVLLPSYKNILPPIDGLTLTKQHAQEVIAHLFNNSGFYFSVLCFYGFCVWDLLVVSGVLVWSTRCLFCVCICLDFLTWAEYSSSGLTKMIELELELNQ